MAHPWAVEWATFLRIWESDSFEFAFCHLGVARIDTNRSIGQLDARNADWYRFARAALALFTHTQRQPRIC